MDETPETDAPEHTIYYRMPDGSLTQMGYDGDTMPALPEGAVLISREEYDTALAAMEAQRQAEYEAQVAAECAAAKQAYDLLVGIGMTPEAARTVSRYYPENCPPAP